MSSSTLRAMSNTGFLFLLSTCLVKSLGKADNVFFIPSKQQNLKLNSLWVIKQWRASTGTPPKKCKALWRWSPSGAGDTVLDPQSSPNTVDDTNTKNPWDLRLFSHRTIGALGHSQTCILANNTIQCRATTIITRMRMFVTCKPRLSGSTAILSSQWKHSTTTRLTFSNRFLRK